MGDHAALLQSLRDTRSYALTSGHFVWLLSNLCKVHEVQIEPSFLLQSFRPPHYREQLIDAMHACGLSAGLLWFNGENLKRSLLPLIVFPRLIVGTKKAPVVPPPGLIVRLSGDRFLYVEAGSDAPRFRMKRNFLEFFEPTVVLSSRLAYPGVARRR
jgi:hypothetical protein